jgi:hypothetical protein
MRHTESWYAELAAALGHPGYVNLAEIRQAEARQARETAATAKWRRRGATYHLDLDLNYYLIQREPGLRTWKIEAWPAAVPDERYVRHQSGIRTLTEAKGLALAQPCFRCGLASPLPFMTPVVPERPGQRSGARPRFRCLDTSVCLAEYRRLRGEEPARMEVSTPADLILHNEATGQSVPATLDPATGQTTLRG